VAPKLAVEGCLLVRRCRGMSRHLVNGRQPPPLTHSGHSGAEFVYGANSFLSM
jgi:hypothetical protein